MRVLSIERIFVKTFSPKIFMERKLLRSSPKIRFLLLFLIQYFEKESSMKSVRDQTAVSNSSTLPHKAMTVIAHHAGIYTMVFPQSTENARSGGK